jgi:hypothetical protein
VPVDDRPRQDRRAVADGDGTVDDAVGSDEYAGADAGAASIEQGHPDGDVAMDDRAGSDFMRAEHEVSTIGEGHAWRNSRRAGDVHLGTDQQDVPCDADEPPERPGEERVLLPRVQRTEHQTLRGQAQDSA